MGHAKGSVSKACGNILRRLTDHGKLRIMDNTGPVHGNTGNDTAFHQVDNDGIEPNFDHMGSHAEQDGAVIHISGADGGYYLLEVAACQNIRHIIQKRPER